jgi:hypothetical protein
MGFSGNTTLSLSLHAKSMAAMMQHMIAVQGSLHQDLIFRFAHLLFEDTKITNNCLSNSHALPIVKIQKQESCFC